MKKKVRVWTSEVSNIYIEFDKKFGKLCGKKNIVTFILHQYTFSYYHLRVMSTQKTHLKL